MKPFTVNIPDKELAVAVESWENGVEYDIRIKQTDYMQGDMISGEAVAAEESEEADTEEGEMETTKKVPARFAVLIGTPK